MLVKSRKDLNPDFSIKKFFKKDVKKELEEGL